MKRFLLLQSTFFMLLTTGCGKSATEKLYLPQILAPNTADFAPTNQLVENGYSAALHAVNATGAFYQNMTLTSLLKYGVGNAVAGDANDILAEQAIADQLMAASPAKLLIGPAYWPDAPVGTPAVGAQGFCTTKQYLCMSLSADQVRENNDYTYSYTTASNYPGWTLGTAYDIKQQGFTNILIVADWDTSFEVPQMETFGVTVTTLTVPADDPTNWATEPNGKSPDAFAADIMGMTWDAVILSTTAQGDAAILQGMRGRGFTHTEKVWLGDAAVFSDFISIVGNAASQGVNKVTDLFADPNSTSYQTYLAQYKAWGNNEPTGQWEISAWFGTMLSIYTIHAEMVAQHATATTALSGTNLRTQLLKLTGNTDPAARSYDVSDAKNILTAITNGDNIAIQGIGLPFQFTDNGKGTGTLQKSVCCTMNGGTVTSTPTLTTISADAVMAAMH